MTLEPTRTRIEWHVYGYSGPYEPEYIHLRYNPNGWTERRGKDGGWNRIDIQTLVTNRVPDRRSPFVPLKTESGRRMLVRASAVEFAIENTVEAQYDTSGTTRRWVPAHPVVHIVLAGGEQGDAAVTWDEFVEALGHAEDQDPGQERGHA